METYYELYDTKVKHAIAKFNKADFLLRDLLDNASLRSALSEANVKESCDRLCDGGFLFKVSRNKFKLATFTADGEYCGKENETGDDNESEINSPCAVAPRKNAKSKASSNKTVGKSKSKPSPPKKPLSTSSSSSTSTNRAKKTAATPKVKKGGKAETLAWHVKMFSKNTGNGGHSIILRDFN